MHKKLAGNAQTVELFKHKLNAPDLARKIISDSAYRSHNNHSLLIEARLTPVHGRTLYYSLDLDFRDLNNVTDYIETYEHHNLRVDTGGEELDSTYISDRMIYEMGQMWDSIDSVSKFGHCLFTLKPEDYDLDQRLIFGLTAPRKN